MYLSSRDIEEWHAEELPPRLPLQNAVAVLATDGAKLGVSRLLAAVLLDSPSSLDRLSSALRHSLPSRQSSCLSCRGASGGPAAGPVVVCVPAHASVVTSAGLHSAAGLAMLWSRQVAGASLPSAASPLVCDMHKMAAVSKDSCQKQRTKRSWKEQKQSAAGAPARQTELPSPLPAILRG